MSIASTPNVTQGQQCRAPEPYVSPKAATTGKTKVLIVFVKFADDNEIGDPCVDYREWPIFNDPSQLPNYAEKLISKSESAPFETSSITNYFHKMSGGKFTFYGDVFPEVVTTSGPASSYQRKSKSGYGYLAKEVLEKIDDRIDYSEFDTNPCDGILDQVIFVIRRDPAASFTGVASLNGADAVYGNPKERIELDGVVFDWRTSGSFLIHSRPGNIVPSIYMTRLLAHEYGHHLWNENGHFQGHLQAIRNNDTPSNGTDRIGYVLMAGRGGGRDSRGDYLISSLERDLLGWIDPIIADTSRFGRYELGDYYSTNEVIKVPLGQNSRGEYFLYLDNRQRVGPYDQEFRFTSSKCTSSFELEYLRTTGLLASLVHKSRSQPRIDILAADDELKLSNSNHDYDGDLYGPESKRQLTPFTRPALALAPGLDSWIAIDNIGMSGRTEMSFDLIPDFRKRPIIREDSWIEDELEAEAFEAPVIVTNRAELHIQSKLGARAILVDPGSSLILETGSSLLTRDLILYSSANFVLKGSAEVTGFWITEPGSILEITAGAELKIGDKVHLFDRDQRLVAPFDL